MYELPEFKLNSVIYLNILVYRIHRAKIILSLLKLRGFPGSAVVENPPASAGDTGSIPGPGRSHMPEQLSLCATTTEPVI